MVAQRFQGYVCMSILASEAGGEKWKTDPTSLMHVSALQGFMEAHLKQCDFRRFMCVQMELVLTAMSFKKERDAYMALAGDAEAILKADPDSSALYNVLNLGKKVRELGRALGDTRDRVSSDLGHVPCAQTPLRLRTLH